MFLTKTMLLTWVTLIITLLISASTYAEQNSIEVSASGKAYTAPEIAHFSLTFENTSIVADEARQQSEKQVRSTLKALQSYAIDQESLDSSQVTLNPAYDYSNNTRKLLGYQVTRYVHFTLENLNQLESLIATLAKNDLARLSQIRFAVKDEREVRARAIQDASARAKEAAIALAASFGTKLGDVISIKHHVEDHRQPSPMQTRAMSLEAHEPSQSSSYEIKRIEFRARVEVQFALNSRAKILSFE